MACKYFYTLSTGTKPLKLEASSVEQLRDLIIDKFNEKNFNETFVDKSFKFYDSGKTLTNITDVVNEMKKKGISEKGTKTVTQLANEIAYKNNLSIADTNFEKAFNLYKRFNQDFGSIIHKSIQLSISDPKFKTEILDEAINIINEFIDSVSRNKDIEDQIKMNNFMFQTYQFCLSAKSGKQFDLKTEIQRISEQIKSEIISDNTILLQEEKIIQLNKDGVDGEKLYGIPDLALMSSDGKIKIIDFKTSGRPNLNPKSRYYHYIQLQSYKKIFESWGIKEDDISGENILINYDITGIKFDKDKNIINPEEHIQSQDREEIRQILNKYFPTKLKELSEDVKDVLDNIKRKQTVFSSGQMLKRFSNEFLTKHIKSAADNKNKIYLYSLKRVAEIYKKDDKIVIIDPEDSTKILDTKSIEDLVKDEQNAIQQQTIDNVSIIKSILLEKNYDKLKNFYRWNKKNSDQLWSNLYKYCSNNYEYISSPEFESLGIIVMKHNTRGYEFIQLVSDASNLQYCHNPNDNILKSIIPDKKLLDKYKESKELDRGSIGNLYTMRAAIAISELKNIFPDDFKLAGINVISVNNGSCNNMIDNNKILKIFQVLQQCCKDSPTLENSNLFINCYDNFKSINMSSVDEYWAYLLVDSLNTASSEFKDTNLNDLSDWKNFKNLQEKLNKLNQLQEYIEDVYKDKIQFIHGDYTITDDGIVHIYKLIKTIKNQLKNMVDFENEMNLYSINYQESIVGGINLLTKGSTAEFTSSGLQLTGLAQGLSLSTSYSSPSKLIQKFQHFYNVATAQIIKDLTAEATELNNATEKFISWGKQNKFVFADSIRGNHDKLYSSLFQTTNGEINQSMLFQNPYSKDCKLADAQKEYLEIILWTINRHKCPYIHDNIRKLSYAELKKDTTNFDKYKEIFNDTKYLEIPLKRKGSVQGTVSSFISVMKGKKTIVDFAKTEMEKYRSIIEHEFLDDTQQQEKNQAAKERIKYVNYFKENESRRVERTEKIRPEEWDWNLNNVIIEYTLADLKEKYFNQLLKIADNQIATISIIEQMTGQDLSNQTTELINKIKVSIYNKSLIDEEFKDLSSTIGVVKSIMAATKIAIRPVLFFKEMLLGRIKNTATILAKQIVQDEGREITLSHLMSAAGIVFGENFLKDGTLKAFNQRPMGSKNIVNLLNDLYTVTDRDLSVIGDKFSYDRYGLHNMTSRMLYVNTTSPDWFNRMIIFIAKMKADGTFDAHSINENGELVYDMSKDKRVAEYWNNRKNPKNTPEYMKAKEYYILKMQQFEREQFEKFGYSELKYSENEQDPFPRAYTVQEEESIKEQIGLIYGYYTHQERASAQKGLWWTLYTQFATYLPAEIRKYLAIGNDSSITKTIHKKDGVTGKPLYWENSENGELTKMTTDTIDKNGNHLRPVLEQVSDPYQGLLISTFKVINRICKGDLKYMYDNPKELRALYLFLFNFLLSSLIGVIIYTCSDTIKQSGSGVQMSVDVITKAANELNFYDSVLKPVGNLGIVGVDFLNNTFTSAFKAATSENSLFDFAEKNLPIIKDAHLNMDM